MPGDNDLRFMKEAIEEARKGCHKTWPNPAVGAVLVRDGEVVARGWHKKAGFPHAEIECLADAAKKNISPEGATMYVTLEPCNHHGKTPPCADALIEAGIKRLVYGIADINSEAAGGAGKLAEAGIEVHGPVLEKECSDLIADFKIWQTSNRPYVILKLASTLDGRIATRNGNSRWISSLASRKKAHLLRSEIGACGGAILIGGSTFRSDNPRLSARLDGQEDGPQPLACILTSRLPKADADFHLLRERPQQTIFFASPASAASTTAEALRKIGCRIFAIGHNLQGTPDFSLMFKILREDLGCPYVMCEGGGKLALSLISAGYVDEFHLHLAPIILGDNEARPLFSGSAPLSLEDAIRMRLCSTSICDGDAHLLLRPLEA